ncbi:hypothetical protein SAMN05414139_01484 [Burkholderia sp. D7]|nr:hypothetical protein SAMN05414139_01484 [Burkholderia sp. D7]
MNDVNIAVLNALEAKLNTARADLDHAIEHDGDTAKARRALENVEKEIAKAKAVQVDAAARAAAEQESANARAAADLVAAAGDDVADVAAEAIRTANVRLSPHGAGQIPTDYAHFDHTAHAVAIERRTYAVRCAETKAIGDRLSGLERKLVERQNQSQAIVDARIAGTVDPKDAVTLSANDKDIERLHVLISNAQAELSNAKALESSQKFSLLARNVDLDRAVNVLVTAMLRARLERAEQELLSAAHAVYADSQANGNRLPTFGSHYVWSTPIEQLFRLGRV